MLLTGTHPRTLDDKNRLALPKRLRDQFGKLTQLFVSPGPDRCLWVYRRTELETLSSKLDEQPATDAEARVFRRLFFAQMESVDLDGMGRVLIPERLMEFAGLARDVVLLGIRDHVEVWDAKRWKSFHDRHAPRFDQFAEEAFGRKK
jgi:MraZ protein